MLKVRIQLDSALGLLARLSAALGGTAEPLLAAVDVVERAIQKNFDAEGRPKRWEALSHPYASWKKRNYPGTKILERSGALRRSITVKVETGPTPESVAIVARSPLKYAAIHNFGGYAGEFKDIYIPRRPYLVLTEADQEEAARAIADSFSKIATDARQEVTDR